MSAGLGVAIREFKMARDHGFADYLLFVDQQSTGAIEAKPEGHTLTGVEGQTKKYSEGLPPEFDAPVRPLPFLYESTGVETRFTNLLDPRPRSRRVFSFHRPETLAEWLEADPLAEWMKGREDAALVAEGPGKGEGYGTPPRNLASAAPDDAPRPYPEPLAQQGEGHYESGAIAPPRPSPSLDSDGDR